MVFGNQETKWQNYNYYKNLVMLFISIYDAFIIYNYFK